jgi:hypothetical protein
MATITLKLSATEGTVNGSPVNMNSKRDRKALVTMFKAALIKVAQQKE